MRSLFVGMALTVWFAGLALAMGIRTERQLLARGPAGATLYELREIGPEGGGALRYRVETGNNRRPAVDVTLSSDFSPGGGTQPQIISAAVCATRMATLAAALKEHRIGGVALHPERCQQEERDGLVIVADPPARRP